jgi:hypothetical protein
LATCPGAPAQTLATCPGAPAQTLATCPGAPAQTLATCPGAPAQTLPTCAGAPAQTLPACASPFCQVVMTGHIDGGEQLTAIPGPAIAGAAVKMPSPKSPPAMMVVRINMCAFLCFPLQTGS